jgi:coenzyme F420-reducing hydrogenase delta subunit
MKLLAFVCERSALRAVEEAKTRGSWPQGWELAPVPCSGRVDILHVTGALTRGYAGVMVVGCFEEACEFLQGNLAAGRRIEYLRGLLKEAGVDPRRVRLEFASPAGAARLARAAREMRQQVDAIGKGDGHEGGG